MSFYSILTYPSHRAEQLATFSRAQAFGLLKHLKRIRKRYIGTCIKIKRFLASNLQVLASSQTAEVFAFFATNRLNYVINDLGRALQNASFKWSPSGLDIVGPGATIDLTTYPEDWRHESTASSVSATSSVTPVAREPKPLKGGFLNKPKPKTSKTTTTTPG